MATYDSSLPKMPIGSPEVPMAGTIVTQMDQGPAKHRRRFTAVPLIVQPDPARYVFDVSQRDTLRTLYDTGTGGGVDPFDWTDPLPGLGAKSVRFFEGRAPEFTAITGGVSDRLYECSVVYEILA